MTLSLAALEAHLARVLDVARIPDACPNGLQVEGRRPPRQAAYAVSASLAAIEAAAAQGADTLIVHHGLFWDRRSPALRGGLGRRVRALLAADMSLFAYHLPLDVHPQLGHGACIARQLGLSEPWEPFGAYRSLHLGWLGDFASPRPVEAVLEQARELFGPPQRAHLFGPPRLRRVAVASGDCPHLLQEAILAGADLLLTGEETEYVQEEAREGGIHFLAQGHYRTEVPGLLALAEHLRQELGLPGSFVDVPNLA